MEYSLEAIKLGSTAIGVATSYGVVLGVEKRVTSTLLETSSVEKIVEIDRHLGCAMSGLQADARSMVEHARVESQNHRFNFNEDLRVESCTQAICDLALRFGEGADGEEKSIMSRPFGVALLVAGCDDDLGPQLYHAEPSGTFYRYDAKAIGSGSEGAQAELQNEYHKVGDSSYIFCDLHIYVCGSIYTHNTILKHISTHVLYIYKYIYIYITYHIHIHTSPLDFILFVTFLPSLTPPQSLTLSDAETLVLKTLKQVMEEKLDSKNVQLASVTKEKGFRIYADDEMAAIVERLPAN